MKAFNRPGFRIYIKKDGNGYKIIDCSGIDHHAVWFNAKQLHKVLSEVQLRQFAKDFAGYYNIVPSLLYATIVWDAIVNFYERGIVMGEATATKEPKEKKAVKEKTAKSYAFELGNADAWAKAAPQVQAILNYLKEKKVKTVNGDQLKAHLDAMAKDGKLTTRQDPMRVFTYYIPKLRDTFKVLTVS